MDKKEYNKRIELSKSKERNIERMNVIIGIVMKPFLTSQIKSSLWKDLYVKQDFADILSKHDATCIGIIPQGISLDRTNGNNIELSDEVELTDSEKNCLLSQIKLCDGLILQGGLSSHNYEVFIAQYAIKHNIPILGICAGFNNISRAIGIEVEYDRELSKKHDIYSSESCHPIIIQDNANVLLLEELSDKIISVNSIHSMTLHKSVIYLNKQINVEAISIDSENEVFQKETIEAFSVKNTKFCLAIKWHPELLPNDEITNIIFKKFIGACKNHN